jgi:hypothetical protein
MPKTAKKTKKFTRPNGQCIAPGCRKPSKGPRFRYCCEIHRDAKMIDIYHWQEAAKTKKRMAAYRGK